MTKDESTTRWIRDASDEQAVKDGCWFDVERGAWAVWWIERYCRLYEGDWAGQPMVLRGAHKFDWTLPVDEPFYEADGKTLSAGGRLSIQRAMDYLDCYHAGQPCDWQYEVTMRMFGWQRFSDRWRRQIRRFREASVWVPKKSKKSPTSAAWGLYLLAGDGEQGQKVFLAAKDGNQARKIAGLHAVEMVKASGDLQSESRINMNEMSIWHEPTRSMLMPLSSSNETTQQAKEGINGSVLVDETHVVDRMFMSRIKRAGISRSEPVLAEFSTAGKNPESYGKERYDYAKEVAAGQRENTQLLVAIYEAPQDLADEELIADPEKYGRMANPAWGHTVHAEEYIADFKESSRSVVELADFKTYRLNQWQRSANPWIRMADWNKCRQQFTEADLLKATCAAAIDMGRTDDMCSLSLVFPENLDEWFAQRKQQAEGERRTDAAVKALTWYWMCEDAIERHVKDYPLLRQWATEGWISAVPGNSIDFAYVEDEMVAILGRFAVALLAFDKRFAERSVQLIQSRMGWPDTTLYKFVPSRQNYTGPCNHFERLVVSGKLHHDGSPVTAWEAGHVRAKTWPDRSKVPEKPGDDKDFRKIDGIVTIIMGLDAAGRMPEPKRSVYETSDIVFL